MAALDFIAGLGGAYTAIDAGMRAAKERQQAEEDREFLKSQRGLMQQQQQRQLDEQKRADTLRAELSAIPTTERIDVDFNKANPETSKITVDDDGSPSATQLPAIRTVERPRPRDAQLRDAAAAVRRSGDVGRAFELEGAAEKEMFNRAARQFAQLKAGSAGMTSAQIARQAQSIFDNDPFPMQVAAIREGADGSVAIDIRNRDTGAMQTWNAKNKDELLSGIEAYYSPDSYQALQRARSEAAVKAEGERLGELYKPRVLKPGEQLRVYNEATGRFDVVAEGSIPAGYEVVQDASGNNVLRRVAAAPGSGKPEDLGKAVDDALKFVAQNSTFKDLSPEQAARAQTLTRLFAAQRPVDPAMAAEAAILAAMKPTEVRTTFDDKTGKIVDAIAFRGGNFIVEDRGGVAKPRDVKQEVMNGIANEYVSTQIPQQDRSLFIAAAYNGEARAALDTKTRQAVLDVLRTRLGREPKPEELAPAQKAAVDATAPILDLIGNHLNAGEKLSGMLAGSGFSLVGGRVVRAPAGQAAQQGGVAAASGAPAAAVGSAIPADAAKRGREAEEERKRREADAAAEQRRKEEEARQKRASDEEAVRGLTVDMVRAMTPEDAARIYRNYSSIIRDPKVREALGLRMMHRPWVDGAGGASAGAAAAAAPAGAAGTAPLVAAQAVPAQAGAPASNAAPARPPAAGMPAPGAGPGLGAAAPARPAAAATASAPAAATQAPAQQPPAGPATPPAQWPRTTTQDGSVVRSPPQKIEIPSVVAMRGAVKSAAAGDTRAIGAALSAVERARADLESYSREALRFTLLPADDARVRAELSKLRNEIGQAENDLAGLAAAARATAPAAQGPAPARAPVGAAQGGGAPPRPAARLPEAERQRIQSRIKDLESAILDGNRRLDAERKKAAPNQREIDLLRAELLDLQSERTDLRKRLSP